MEETKNSTVKETAFRKFVRNLVINVEKIIIKSLIILMSILLIAATIELVYQTIITLIFGEGFLISVEGLMDLFGIFLLVLIGIELLDTIKVYFKRNVVHVEVVVLVAIIAIARKVIVLDFSEYSGLEIIGIGVIIITLTMGYYLIKKAGGCKFYTKELIETDADTKEKIKHVKEKTIKDDSGNTLKSDIEDFKRPPCSGVE